MLKFIVRRALWTIPVILLVVLMTFVMMRQIKGNPFQVTERAVPVSIQRNLDRKYHLDRPWYTQYFYYVKGVFTFDLGPSLVQRNQTVNDIIKEHFPVSLKLGALAMAWAILLHPIRNPCRVEAKQHLRLHDDGVRERRLRHTQLPDRDPAHLLLPAQMEGLDPVPDERLDRPGELGLTGDRTRSRTHDLLRAHRSRLDARAPPAGLHQDCKR